MNYLVAALAVIGLGLGLLARYEYDAYAQEHEDFGAYKAAQAQKVADQTKKVKEAQRLQAAAEGQAKVDHDKQATDNARIVGTLNARMRSLAAALHDSALHPPVADTGRLPGGPARPGEAGGSEQAAADLIGAAQDAAAACLATDANWRAIIALAPKP